MKDLQVRGAPRPELDKDMASRIGYQGIWIWRGSAMELN
jgi:hypothetical protein